MPGLLCCNGLTNLLLMAIVVLLIWGQADIDDAQTLQNPEESTRIAQQREDDEQMSKAVFTLEAISEDIDLMYRTTRECQRTRANDARTASDSGKHGSHLQQYGRASGSRILMMAICHPRKRLD